MESEEVRASIAQQVNQQVAAEFEGAKRIFSNALNKLEADNTSLKNLNEFRNHLSEVR